MPNTRLEVLISQPTGITLVRYVGRREAEQLKRNQDAFEYCRHCGRIAGPGGHFGVPCKNTRGHFSYLLLTSTEYLRNYSPAAITAREMDINAGVAAVSTGREFYVRAKVAAWAPA